MEKSQHERIEQLLYGLHCWEDLVQRKVFLGGLLRGHQIWLDIKYGSQREAAESLLRLCEEHASKLLHGQRPICALLQTLREEYASESEPQAKIERLLTELCSARADRPRATWKGKPYRGLAYFDRRHEPIFFGREAELQGLIEAVATEQGQRFLMVVGASGAGKSSLVRAGLWAKLQRGAIPELPGSEDWLITVMTPTDMGYPLASLRAASVAAIKEHDGLEDLLGFDWDQALDNIETGTGSLANLAEALLGKQPRARWLVILDQMEELFTAVDESQRETFIEQLIDASKPPSKGRSPRLQVLATLRADFFHHCVTQPNLRLVVERGGQFPLGPPDRRSLERMVTGPFTEVDLLEKDNHGNWAAAHWTLAPELAPEIAAEAAGREGGLALMAFALRELYERCAPRRHLDLITYRGKDFGGLGGAIARRADATLQELGRGFDAVLGRVFARLAHLSEEDLPTRRRERLSAWDHDPQARRLVDRFVQARLLVTRGGREKQATVEVAHEALLREWPMLVEWIKDTREALRLRDRVHEETRTWVHHDRPVVRLWKHELLEPARRLLAQAELLADLEQESDIADFLTPEADWLHEELLCSLTGHTRREAIGMRLSEIGDPRPGVGVIDGVPDILWCDIPAGEVQVEGHGHFEVAHLRMAAYPITYTQYRAFLDAADGYPSDAWWQDLEKSPEPGAQLRPYASYPADNVSWYDATAFCRWLSARLGLQVRLPDEWEWQWAAQSAREEFSYPWGANWQAGLANTYESGIGRTTAVGMYPGGRSGQGLYDLAGNLFEWCRNEYGDPSKTQPRGNESRVLRGGSWFSNQGRARADSRYNHPLNRDDGFGFRVVCGAPIR